MAEFINYQKKYKKLTKDLAPVKVSNSRYSTPKQIAEATKKNSDNVKKEVTKVSKKPEPLPPPAVPPTGMTRITL